MIYYHFSMYDDILALFENYDQKINPFTLTQDIWFTPGNYQIFFFYFYLTTSQHEFSFKSLKYLSFTIISLIQTLSYVSCEFQFYKLISLFQ